MTRLMPGLLFAAVAAMAISSGATTEGGQDRPLRVTLIQQPLGPNGASPGPGAMASGGIRALLEGMGAEVRVTQLTLTPEEETEYGGWKRLSFALGHLGRAVAASERRGDLQPLPEGGLSLAP